MTNPSPQPNEMALDLHVHTSIGSKDCNLSLDRLTEAAYQVGIHGFAVTEHDTSWTPEHLERYRQESGLFVCAGREWPTNWGHVIALGLDYKLEDIRRLEELRRLADEANGYLILAHPFRFFPGPSNYLFGLQRDASALTSEEMARHPVWELVDEIEVLNYNCTDKENELAVAVARVLGKRGTAGSDAHTFSEVGRCVTVLKRAVASEGELIDELRAGRHYLARRRPSGEYVPLAGSV
jgi:predicted metal-dependent phosphoesterase TrpH